MKKIIITSIIISFIISPLPSKDHLMAQDEVQEVINLTAVVEKRLEKVKNSDATTYAQEEINIIDGYIKETRRLIKAENFKRAYYVISIAMAYFNQISAKTTLNNSKRELKKIKEELNE